MLRTLKNIISVLELCIIKHDNYLILIPNCFRIIVTVSAVGPSKLHTGFINKAVFSEKARERIYAAIIPIMKNIYTKGPDRKSVV